MLAVLRAQGDLTGFEILSHQPFHRDRPLADRLHRFIGTRSGRKLQYGSALVEALEPEQLPLPLVRLLAYVTSA